jgi:hypothetical protein
MYLADKIRGLYPDLTLGVEYQVMGDGLEEWIAWWEAPYPKPTEEELEDGAFKTVQGDKTTALYRQLIEDVVNRFAETQGDHSEIPPELMNRFTATIGLAIVEGLSPGEDPGRGDEIRTLFGTFRHRRKKTEDATTYQEVEEA